MNQQSSVKKYSFSLVEVLVVISIIAILAGILTVALDQGNENKMHLETRGEISKIEMALNQFNLDTGDYPNYAGLLANAPDIDKLKSYETFKTTDAWGNEIQYFSHAQYGANSSAVAKKIGGGATATFYNHRSFQLISSGKDEQFGDYYSDSQVSDEAKDNIANYEIKE
jgi:general secretion pathway protein G